MRSKSLGFAVLALIVCAITFGDTAPSAPRATPQISAPYLNPVALGGVLFLMISYVLSVSRLSRRSLAAALLSLRRTVGADTRFEDLFETAPWGVALVDADWRLVRVNAKLADMLGRSREGHEGKLVYDLLPGLGRDLVDETKRLSNAGAPRLFSLELATGAVLVSFFRIETPSGKLTGFAVGAFDSGDPRLSEKRMQRQLERLKSTNSDLDRFAYTVAHDLKEPVRTAMTSVQMLQLKGADELSPELSALADDAIASCERMACLTDALLNYARAGGSRSRLAKVDLNTIFQEAIAPLKASVRDAGARVLCDRLPEIAADPIEMLQLFQNLMSNALKFRAPGRTPILEIGSAMVGGKWKLWFRDNGIGFDPALAEEIFRAFNQIDKNAPGAGIGLATCRRIVEAHGGLIWATSRPGEGTTIHLTLSKFDVSPSGATSSSTAPD